MLAGIDGRSVNARRFRDLVAAFTGDLGHAATEGERALVRQAAALTVQSEAMQADLVNGEPINSEQLTRVSNSLQRCLATLHIRAKPAKRDAVGEVDNYLEGVR
jgi:hypothetical protein